MGRQWGSLLGAPQARQWGDPPEGTLGQAVGGPSWGHPWAGSGGTLRSARLPVQVAAGGVAVTMLQPPLSLPVPGLRGEGGSRPLPAAPPESGTTQSPMGQFLSSTLFEDSLGAEWHKRLYEGEGKGAGEAALVLQDQVICWGERELGLQQAARRHSVSRKGWSRQDPGGPPPRARGQPAKGTSASGLFD